MLALLASYFVIFYFLIPSRIFRIAGLFLDLKKFRRTQIEEITFAFLFASLPFCLAAIAIFVLQVRGSGFAFASWRDYREFFEAAYSEKLFGDDSSRFWRALPDVFWSQLGFLLPYYGFCFLEMLLFVALVSKWGDWHERFPRYKTVVGKFLGNISQWDMILTAFNSPHKEHRITVADVLVVDDHLYQGVVRAHFLDNDGELSGLFLVSPYRFNRRAYTAAKEKAATTRPEEFWVPIPGEILYIPKDKILNLNLWYPPDTIVLPGSASPALNSAAATTQLANEGLPYTVIPVDEETPH